jgi:hypothetical protein
VDTPDALPSSFVFDNKITNPYLTPCQVKQNATENPDPYFHYDVPITSSHGINIPNMTYIKWCDTTPDGLKNCESLHDKLIVLNDQLTEQSHVVNTTLKNKIQAFTCSTCPINGDAVHTLTSTDPSDSLLSHALVPETLIPVSPDWPDCATKKQQFATLQNHLIDCTQFRNSCDYCTANTHTCEFDIPNTPAGYCVEDPNNKGFFLAKTKNKSGWGSAYGGTNNDRCYTNVGVLPGETTKYNEKPCVGGWGKERCLTACDAKNIACQ